MWHLGTRFRRQGGVGVTAGLDDLRGLLQPSGFRDSVKRPQAAPEDLPFADQQVSLLTASQDYSSSL